MKITIAEAVDALLETAEVKAMMDERAARLLPTGTPEEMAAATQRATATVADIRTKRAANRAAFAADPAAAALRFGDALPNLLGLLGIG